MARIKSRMPQGWATLAPEQQENYLSDLDRVVPSRTDLAASPSNADISTALNLLFEHMREAGLMKRST